jgi:transposase
MIYAKINEEDEKVIRDQLRATKDAKWYRRLKIIQLSREGKTVAELSEIFEVSEATIRQYIHRYNEGGLCSLKPQSSPGRPIRISFTRHQWEEILHQSPSQFQLLNTAARNWNQQMLVDYCKKYLGIEITQGRIAQIFKQLGLKWNRAKLKVTSPDPLYTVKRKRIEQLKKK